MQVAEIAVKDMSEFGRLGYCHVPSLLTPDEVQRYRMELSALSGVCDEDFGKKVFECADGVSKNAQFWDLIDHPALLATVRRLLGPEIRYTQHSDLHAHRTGGWHRDCACRQFGIGPDWDQRKELYQVVRVAIYLQSYAESGSSLGVVPGSHRFERRLTDVEWKKYVRKQVGPFSRRIARRLGRVPKLEALDRNMTMWTEPEVSLERGDDPKKPVWIKTEPGDCIIFDQRLYHSASPIHGPKYAIYLSYSPENQHARNHMGYYRHFRKDLNYEDLPESLATRLSEQGLLMDAPPPERVDGYFANAVSTKI